MFERQNFTPEQDAQIEARFDQAKSWWESQILRGTALKTPFFSEVFESPQTEIYRELCDEELLLHVSKTLNGSWVGNNSHGIRDLNNR